ncbi:hypothetical protein, partial [Gulbenkiania mobilis]|uniref:hypothetical protein n=1 Tax=Gulbenkiania mobilis TaxID=397457 RepID=UPI001F2D7D45
PESFPPRLPPAVRVAATMYACAMDMSPVPVFLGGWWPGRRGPGIVAIDDSGQGKRGDGACRGAWAVRLTRRHADGAVQA